MKVTELVTLQQVCDLSVRCISLSVFLSGLYVESNVMERLGYNMAQVNVFVFRNKGWKYERKSKLRLIISRATLK